MPGVCPCTNPVKYMRKLFLLLAVVACSTYTDAQVSINNSNFLYGQDFNALGTQTNIGYPMNLNNWQLFEFGTGGYVNNQYRGGNGNDPSAEVYSFGQAGSTERALGSVAKGTPGSLEAHYGVSFINNTGSTINAFHVGFKQEQWRVGDASTLPDTVRFYYSTNATSVGDLGATWTEVAALRMTSSVTDSNTSGSALNGNLYSSNKFAVIGVTIAAGGTIRVKFVDRDNPGEDDGLAVDNFYAHIGSCQTINSFVATNATCHGYDDGTLSIETYGGQSPYQYSLDYAPFVTMTNPVFTNLEGNNTTTHNIQIKESSANCISQTNIAITEPDSTIVSFGVSPASCQNNDGMAWANVILTNGPYSYSWNTIPVQTNDTAFSIPDGTYAVSITDGSGCIRTDTLVVPVIPLYSGEEICGVTVDSTTDQNLLVWNKIAPPGSLDKYYIYRADSFAANYALLDSVDYTAMSTYLDMTSFPSSNYYSYYITAKSACGESAPSPAHTEKRLTGTYAGGNYILTWNDYIGLTNVDSQYVFYSFNGGPFTLFSTVPVAQPGEAHFNPPNGYYRYFVGLPKTGGCSPQMKSSAYEYIMSNIVENTVNVVSVNNVAYNSGIVIYPNPSNGVFNLSIDQAIGKAMQLQLTDILGKLVNEYSFTNEGTQTVNLKNVPAGTYTIRVVAEDKAWVSKVTIQ
jgi:hypothetical protein